MGYKARQSRYSDLKDEVPPGGVFENVAQSKKPDSQKLPFSCKYVDFKCNKKNHSLVQNHCFQYNQIGLHY
jgi:hypothetical protein